PCLQNREYCSESESCVGYPTLDGLSRYSGDGTVAHRILIADDQATVRNLLRRELERTGSFEVCGEAVDGADAVAKAENLRPDLIVLDFRMPVLNGLEAASVINKALPAIPIFLFTLFNTPELKTAAATAGIRQVISKEVGIKALLAAIDSAIQRDQKVDPSDAISGAAAAVADNDANSPQPSPDPS